MISLIITTTMNTTKMNMKIIGTVMTVTIRITAAAMTTTNMMTLTTGDADGRTMRM